MSAVLLQAALETAVPLALAELERRGGPDATDWQAAQAYAATLAEKGDQLLYRSRETAAVFAGLVRALAVLAFAPGGVRLLGLHWERPTPEEHR
jgi:hypothetical protein